MLAVGLLEVAGQDVEPVNLRRRTPLPATLRSGGIVFALTIAMPLLHLVALTSTITPLVFAPVNLAQWRLRQRQLRSAAFRVP